MLLQGVVSGVADSGARRHPDKGDIRVNWLRKLFGRNDSPAQAAGTPTEPPDAPSCPWETRVVTGDKALETLLALRAAEPSLTPIALGDDEDLARVLEAREHETREVGEILAASEHVDIAAWLEERVASDPEYYQDEGADADEPGHTPPLTLAFDVLTGKPKPRVHIALLPTDQAWQAPAWLKIGNWNECPPPEVHAAFFKAWHRRYAATVIGVGPDTVEFAVDNPPATLEEARLLAREQFVYCADIVHQGVQSVENLAKVLVGSRNWYFWWD